MAEAASIIPVTNMMSAATVPSRTMTTASVRLSIKAIHRIRTNTMTRIVNHQTNRDETPPKSNMATVSAAAMTTNMTARNRVSDVISADIIEEK